MPGPVDFSGVDERRYITSNGDGAVSSAAPA